MNTVLWIAQLILAGVFLVTGVGKVLAYDKVKKVLEARAKGGPIALPAVLAVLLGLVEIAAAVCVILPIEIWPPYIFLRLVCAGIALLMVAAGIYHIRRKESAAPSVVLFLLALFVIVGRWPR